MSDFVQEKIEERRLRILETIASDGDEAMSDERIKGQLDIWAWKARLEVVQQDMRYLESVGALRIIVANDVLIGALAQLGRQHLAREATIIGVQRAKAKF